MELDNRKIDSDHDESAITIHEGTSFSITKRPSIMNNEIQAHQKVRYDMPSTSSSNGKVTFPSITSESSRVVVVKKCVDSMDTDGMTRLSNEYNVLSRLQEKFEERKRASSSSLSSRMSTTPPPPTPTPTMNTTMMNGVVVEGSSSSSSAAAASVAVALKKEPSVRTVLARNPPTGRIESIDLEYIEGTSLKEWIVQLNNNNKKNAEAAAAADKEGLLERVKVAHAVAKALAEVHELGMVHNDVTASNFIVVDEHVLAQKNSKQEAAMVHFAPNSNSIETSLGSCSSSGSSKQQLEDSCCGRVKIIDFGYATVRQSLETCDCGEIVNDDIPALAEVIRLIFSDGVLLEEEDDDDKDVGDENDDGSLGLGGFEPKAPLTRSLETQKHPTLIPNLPRSVLFILEDLPQSSITTSFLHSAHSNGTETKGTEPFGTAREIELDLAQLLEEPDVFLFDPPENNPPDELHFSSTRIHGRAAESAALIEACKRIIPAKLTIDENASHEGDGYSDHHLSTNKSVTSATAERRQSAGSSGEIVLIGGRTGVGKSELIRRVLRPWITQQCNGYFVQGKFDQLKKTIPYSAFRVAFGDLCEMILERGEETTADMSKKILSAVGSVGALAHDVVPNLVKIIGPQPPDSTELMGYELQNRFDYVIRKFVSAISTPEHPMVIFLDDLQWADEASLNLVRTLVRGSTALLVASYREDEVMPDSLFGKMLREVEASSDRHISATKIHVPPLSMIAVEDLVSYTLRMSRRLVRPLADVVLNKTDGNTFFVIQYLLSLRDENMLTYDKTSERWRWCLDELRSREISDDLVDLFASKIDRLNEDARGVLTLAAGVGSTFRKSTLLILLGSFLADNDPDRGQKRKRSSGAFRESLDSLAGVDVGDIIRLLEKEGLIMGTGIGSSLRYKFSHDQIQRAAYSLTPEVDRPLLHLRIGRLLHINAQYYENVGKNLFLIVEQLNRGKDLIDEDEERLSLARLNLMAGERSIQSSAFVPALTYLRMGLSLLTPDEIFSSKHYDTSLRLYSSTAEAEFVNGNIEEMEDAVAVITKHAACFLDRFPSYLCLVKSYISRGKTEGAISTGFDVLSRLGEPFPKSSGTLTMLRDLIKTKQKLRGKTDDQLKELPVMKDDSKIAAMRMLNLMYSCCYIAKPDLLPLVVFRMVCLSVKYGLSHVSAFAFAAYGMIQSAFLGNSKKGYRFGQIALSILEKFDTKELTSRTIALVWYFIAPWRENPLSEALEHFTFASKIGMEVGDHEYAMYNLLNFAVHSLFAGRPLAICQDENDGFQEYASSLNQDITKQMMMPFRQGILNLMGRSDDPLILQGTVMNENELLENEVAPENHQFILHLVLYVRIFLSYTFGDYKAAAEIAEMSRKSISKAFPGMFIVANYVFYDGLTACALVRESKANSRKHKKAAKIAMKKIKRWAAQTPSNCLHKLRLLEAEHDAMRGKRTSACMAYEVAIDAAHKSGVTQDEALAHERAALFFRELGDEKKASRYLAIAHQLYLDWGADAKSSQLQAQYSTMVSQARRRRSFQDYMVCRTASVSPKLEIR